MRWYPSMPCRSPGPHPGGKLRGLAWGGFSRQTPRGEVEESGLGGSPGPHPGGKSGPHLGGGICRPTPRGKLRGLAWGVSRPTPIGGLQAHTQGGLQAHTQGQVEGSGLGGLQAHTHRGSPGPHPGESPGPHLGGSPGPHLGGGISACTEADTPHPDGHCCGRYASYWNAFLFRQSVDGNWTGITVMPKHGHRYRYNSSCSVKTSM